VDAIEALVFEYKLARLAIGRVAGLLRPRGYLTPLGFLRYRVLPDPPLPADDWVLIRTRYCGICGSDHKQVFLDGNVDNPMTAVISWPQILGHEVVGRVERVGPAVTRVHVGDRVLLNPWISCLPRGIRPPCEPCRQGKNTLCRNFTKGLLAPGIHSGNSRDATGGFATLVPAHESMAVPIPEGISWEHAVLADPFSVAFHSVLKVRLWPGSLCAVYGCGNLGLLTVHILKNLFEGIRVLAIARFPHQAEMARTFGADLVLEARPTHSLVEQVAAYVGCEVHSFNGKRPWLIEGVDFLFDTVASPETLEIGMRIVKARVRDRETKRDRSGSIVVTGVSSPGRFEWTPWYFKDLRMIGSNAFSIEEFDGRREHAFSHYFQFLREGRADPSRMITHRFPLTNYREALVVAREQKKSRAIKVLFSYPEEDSGK
jgi:threonine dehydrogenase-like Zn-dependent dehydrogenase